MHLTLLHKLPTPYNDEFFRTLYRHMDAGFRVIHLWRGSDKRPWTTPLGAGYPNGYMRPKATIDVRELRAAWRERDSFYLFGDWGNIESWWLILARMVHNAPYGIWADTPQEQVPRHPVKRFLRRQVLRVLLRRADVVVGTGRAAVKTLRQMGAREVSLLNLPMMVAVPERNPYLDRPAVDGPFVYGTAATLYHRKGIDTLLRAFAKLHASGGRRYLLRIAGAGPDEGELRELANSLGCGDAIRWCGWMEPDQMENQFWGAIDCYVHPARWDPYPLTVLEAMAHGIPTIATTGSGSAVDRLEDGQSGFLVQPEDFDSMSSRMACLAEDRETQIDFSVRGFSEIGRITYEVGAQSLLTAIARATLMRK